MRTILKDHNLPAYKKVMRAFETSDRTCVCHPTGTGKSYIAAAVAESFDKVLILAPNIFVLNQQRNVLAWKKNVDYMTYPGLTMNVCDLTKKYDLIVLDEFHRTGADEWGAAVRLLIDSQPQAKILGTTATPIRYLDGERDMSDELFYKNVASQLSIAEAWNRHILPIPTYVTGIFNFDNIVSEACERIEKSHRISASVKRDRIYKISNARLDWEQSSGMVRIIRKHIDKDTRRIIVFCPDIDRLSMMKRQADDWFRKAGFSIAHSIILNSAMTSKEQREAMEIFEGDDGEGLRIVYSVNILNEGVHVPRVGAVLMLRTTASRIIYMQQLGRALTAANTERPVILDMVDNITTTTAIKDFAEEFELLEIDHASGGDGVARRFEVFDYTQTVRQLVEKLVPEEYSHLGMEERLIIIQDFVRKHNRLPMENEPNEYRHWRWLNVYAHDDERVYEIRLRYGALYTVSDRIKRIKMFVDKNGRFPKKSNDGEATVVQSWNFLKKTCFTNPAVIELMQKEEALKDAARQKWLTDSISAVRAFCEQNNRIPTYNRHDKLASVWMNLRKKHPQNQDVIDIAQKYTKTGRLAIFSLEERIRMVEDECKATGYLPRACNNPQIHKIWHTMQRNHPNHPDVVRIAATYKKYEYVSETAAKNIAEVVAWCDEHHCLPSKSLGKHLCNKLYHIRKTYPEHPEVVRILATYKTDKTTDDRVAMVKAYYEENADFPTLSLNKQVYFVWQRLCKHHSDHPEVQRLMKIAESRPKTRDIQQRIDRYKKFLAEHGRHARKGKEPNEYHIWNKLREYADYYKEIQEIIDQYGWSYTDKTKPTK